MTEPSVLLTHGPAFYWAAFALAALLGPLTAWLVARAGARRRAAAARDQLGSPGGLHAPADGKASVLSGVLELEGADGSLESGPGEAVAATATRFLRVGDTRVALEGDLELRAGSRERWGVDAADAPPDASHPGMWRLAAHRFCMAPGQRARARGTLQILPAAGEQSYREAGLRHVLVPGEGGRIGLAAERRPGVRLTWGLTACALLLFASLFTGLSCAGARFAGGRAWDAAGQDQGDLDSARRAMRWGTLAAAPPFRRQWALDAIESALRLSGVDDPEAHRDLVLLSASYERYRTGSCADALSWIDHGAGRRFVAEVGQACGDPASLRAAGNALMARGEFDAAADLAARSAVLDPARTVEQVKLERSSNLLAGRLERGAALIREMLPRIDEFYEPSNVDKDVALWRAEFAGKLRCAADQLAARAGDAAARSRLDAAAWSAASAPPVRGMCALLLADLAGGEQRLAIVDRIRRDPALAKMSELELLEAEADPTRAAAERMDLHVTTGARILSGRDLFARPDALQWSALDRLAAVDPPPPARLWRANLAAALAAEASLVGDDDRALTWSDMLDRDWTVLRSEGRAYASDAMRAEQLANLALQRVYIELRAVRAPRRPPQLGAVDPARRSDDVWRELEGVLDFLEKGDLGALERPIEYATYARGTGGNGPLQGLAIAARGSGADLARWLEDRYDSMTVALVAARRIETGRREMLDWLRRLRTPSFRSSLGQVAIDAANRQKVAEALGAPEVAAEHRAVAERLRRGILRRDTAMVRRLLLVE